MRNLTMKMLEEAEPHSIIATGVVTEPQLHPTAVRWVAVRGGIADWAIYYNLEDLGVEFAKTNGDKVTTANLIQNLVPCDGTVLLKYRI